MNTRLLIPFALILLSNAPCSPALYTPPVQNVPLPSQKGDAHLTVSWGESGIDIQSAGAISKRNLIMANVRIDSKKITSALIDFPNRPQSALHHEQFSGEVGFGKYGRFGKLKYGAWSVLGGYGLGSTTETPIVGNAFDQATMQYQRFFIQPAIGYNIRSFDIAFSCQGAWVKSGRISSESALLEGQRYSALTLEPAITFSMGGENFRFFTQLSTTIGNRDYFRAAGLESSRVSKDDHLSLGTRALFGGHKDRKY